MSGEWRMALFLLGALFTFLFHTRRATRRALRDDLLKLESERPRSRVSPRTAVLAVRRSPFLEVKGTY